MPNTPQPPLLAAKFFRPTLPPQQVARTALVAHLQAGLEAAHPLSLISAPAGYGKSTLAAQWLAQVERPVAWLSLEAIDDEPLRFFNYFVAALQRLDPQIGAELAPALAAGQLPPPEVLLTTLVNDLVRAETPGLVALDDFQSIQDQDILHALQGLLTHRPPHFHLLLITREDPALPLARWRAKNRLTEIRAADLRFDVEETARFLRGGMGLNLAERDMARLVERTEGWAAGLQLAALAMQSPLSPRGRADPAAFVRSLSGSHRFILSYLTEEVLKRQPPAVQEFLLRTAILSQLNGDLCDALTGRDDSAALLETLLAANLFLIPLDEEGRWYRYHHLFADLLRTELRRTHPDGIPALHRRASRWFEAHHRPAEAIEHALAAEDFERVMVLLETHLWHLLIEGATGRIEGWMEVLSAEQRIRSPRVSLGLAWMYLLRGQFEGVIPYWQRAAAALADEPDRTALRAECLALEANLRQFQGDVHAALKAGQRALALVKPEDRRVVGLANLALGGAHRQAGDFAPALEALQNTIRASQVAGDAVSVMLAISHLTLMSLQHGRLHLAADVAAQALAWLKRAAPAPPPIVGAVYGALGRIHYEWGRVEEARAHFERGIHLGTLSGHTASVIYAQVNLAQLAQAAGDLPAAEKRLAEAEALFQRGGPDWLRAALIAGQASLQVAQGRLVEAEAALRRSGVTMETPVTHRTDALHLAWLRLLAAQRSPQADELARRIVRAAEAGERDGTRVQALVLGALLPTADVETRRDRLARALALAAPEGYVRTFVDAGPPLAALLRQMECTPYVERLLTHFPTLRGADAGGALVEPLTEREWEVLHLLDEGLTYAEIAAQLVVSINTVRYHVKALYGKLGVRRRSDAVERARTVGLLQHR
jgi:LuxR family maltose regulon positive regulatory protein